MTLGALKKALSKYPPDMNDMEIFMLVARKDKRQEEPLCLVGYMSLEDNGVILLGGITEVQRMVGNGEIEKPEGYIGPEDSDSYIF